MEVVLKVYYKTPSIKNLQAVGEQLKPKAYHSPTTCAKEVGK